MSNNQFALDENDIRIVHTLDSLPYRSSTKKISEILDIPSRSIRYRLAKMREKKLLEKQTVITHERKLGIREFFTLVNENPARRETLQEIIETNPALSWYVPTFGTYQGFTIHSINAMGAPNFPLKLMGLLKEKKIIADFFHFEVIDFQEYGWNYKYFNNDGEWTWNWKIWEEYIQLKKYNRTLVSFEENPEMTNFDYLDIQILKLLYQDENFTQKKAGEKLALSESQIGRRIRSMEENGIIRGYRTGFSPFSDSQIVLCLIKVGNSLDNIVNILMQIPYPKTIAYEDRQTIGLGFDIPTNELGSFLKALHVLRPQIDSYFLQFQLSNPIVNPEISFDLFEKDTNDWHRLTKEYKRLFKRVKAI